MFIAPNSSASSSLKYFELCVAVSLTSAVFLYALGKGMYTSFTLSEKTYIDGLSRSN